MFNIQFNTLAEALLMQSQNGQNHGIYVWSVYALGISMIVISFSIAKKRIAGIQKKIKINNASS